MLANIQNTNLDTHTYASGMATMQSDTPNGSSNQDGGKAPRYDKHQKTIFGNGYSIKFYTRVVSDDEIKDIFYYEDKNTSFYFWAEREKWSLDRNSARNFFVDSEVYRILILWCEKPNCIVRKDFSEHLKAIARTNIAEGMMVMEGENDKPPRSVIFERT